MNKECVSILMPVKNVERYIQKSIDSVLSQTYRDFELIILDDSDDTTSEIIKSYSDERIKHLMIGGNISRKLNYGLQIAQYDYISRMDGDDIIDSKKIEKQISFLRDKPQIDVLGTNFYCINEKGTIIYEKKLPEFHKDIEFMMPFITSVLHSSIMLKKSTYLKIAPYNETLTYAEDLDVFLRALGKIKFYNIQNSLYYYRSFNNRKTIKNNRVSYLLSLNYLSKKLEGAPNNNETLFQIGLLEYYKNDIAKARRTFIKLLFYSNIKKFKILRYLIPSLLGNVLLKGLRNFGVLSKLNSNLLRIFNYDTNMVNLK